MRLTKLNDSLRSEYWHAPPARAGRLPPLVLVHGQSRDLHRLAAAFLPWTERYGVELIAPHFTQQRHRGYQRLRTRSKRRGAADVFDDVLADAGIGERRIWLFGFSGGAQFAHRYALVRPQRIAALSIAAAGWYTFPDPNLPYPYGIAPGSLPGGQSAELDDFLRLPVQVLVGEQDIDRDTSLRRSARVDRQQGPNRVTRAMAWVDAMSRVAAGAGPRFELLPGVGHSFGVCARRAALAERVLSWLIATERARARLTPETDQKSECETMQTTGVVVC